MLFTWCMSLRISPTTPGPSLATKRHPRDSPTFVRVTEMGVSADANKPKSVVRKLRNKVIDRYFDIRPN